MNARITEIILMIVPLLFSISLHEVCHGLVARRLGDPTAHQAGRLTLNPLKHLDPLGLIVPFITYVTGGIIFGWAKPVPVDPRYFKNPRKGMLWVALAGPTSNFALAAISFIVLQIVGPLLNTQFLFPLKMMISYMVTINVSLTIINLIPIPPLDGGRIMVGILPARMAYAYARIEPYGIFILLGLILLLNMMAQGRF